MGKVSLSIQKQFCAECSLALRRFIGNLDGIEAVDLGNETIDISFDGSKISEEMVRKLSRDSVEKLGYKLLNDE
ncbi:MAG TPA: heavy-metal-associated domain-containing protein [Nitrospirota bacterium]|nr:heavy-metal-associated domain-containing protein [Nitrospirota bacterium]